ncbi:MAG: GNAT family N-acetyltransferase [Rhodocyclaceae bacterium]|nr:GNAT family N-acetyltransferase [Rhodocyclaceae bacterium]MBL0074807.1 GNAT family N-acetyltransferase [Rhodocyclaceae bacterium]
MKTNIRTPSLDDANAICHVVRRSITECCAADHKDDPELLAAWLQNKTPDNVRRWLQTEGALSVVAEIQGAVAGFALATSLGELMLCYLVPEARFTGVGRAMLAAIERKAAAVGIDTLHLESTRTARDFYLRYGFSPTGPAELAFGIEGYPMNKPVKREQ